MVNMVDQIQEAIKAHKIWKERLSSAIENEELLFDPQMVQRDDACSFGQWLYGTDIPEDEKQKSSYLKVKTWHAAFHKEAAYILDLVKRHKIDEARQAMAQEGQRYFQVSAVLLALLDEWVDRLKNQPPSATS